MDFIPSEDQTLLKNSVGRFCADLAADPAAAGSEAAARHWAGFAELGLLGLPFAEDFGGSAAGAPEIMIVAEELGRHLLRVPYVPAIAIAGRLIAETGDAAQRERLLPAIGAGGLVVVPAFAERQGRFRLSHVETRAEPDGAGYRLSGGKAVVLNAPQADRLLVSARLSGGPSDRVGVALFLVEVRQPGVSLRPFTTLDGRSAAELVLDDVAVDAGNRLGGEAFPAIERAMDRGAAALCGEAVGAMAALIDLTVEHLRTRRQFGMPIGKFQALQHRVVDMRTAYELARSLAAAASIAADLDDDGQRRRIVSAAKVQIGRSGRFIGQQAIQLHGAMGMTDEYPAGRYLKRLLVLGSLYGDADHHLDRFQEWAFAASAA